MPGVKVTNFMGVAPKVSPELLPDTAAQIARNAKLYSGDLIPYTYPVVKDNALRNGVIRTIHALREPGTGNLKWLSWLTDVDIVVATPDNTQDLDQRYYYTGDGRPKVSNYELSFSGPAPYPFNWYDLGLPLPPDNQVLSTVATPIITSESVTFRRDNANIATITTLNPHGLISGNEVTITGFTYRSGTYSQSSSVITVTIANHGLAVGAQVALVFKTGDSLDSTFTITGVTDDNTFTVTASNTDNTSGNVDWDIRSFNATNAEITRVNATEFTYFSPGSAVEETVYTAGKISLAGNTQERKYVFTWLTPWDEESIASRPSESLYIKEGQAVTISNIPFQKPDGNNFVRGVRIYRTLPSANETDFYRLVTLWFPVALDTVQRTGNVVTLQTYYPHNLGIEDRFRLAYCTDASFDGDFVVTDVLDQYTITYAQTAADVAETAVSGYIYHDIAEDPVAGDPPRYWGYYSYDVFDDYDSKALTDILTTDEYDPPPSGLRGLTVIQNNILAGYVGNTVYFSEPKLPHAWPKEYATVLEHNIVGLAVLSGSLVVLTDGYPYLISGSDPAAGMSINKIDALFPCVARRGIVKLANAVAYPTNDGIAVYTPFGGSQLITKYNYNDDTWKADLDPRTIIAGYYNEAYFASFGNAPQAPGEVPEPTPPAITEPALPPEPIGGPIDGGGDGTDPGPIDPEDPTLLYSGTIYTESWTAGAGTNNNWYVSGWWYGYLAANTVFNNNDTPVAAHGAAVPSTLVGSTNIMAEVTCSRVFVSIFNLNTYTRISIKGYAANPVGTPDEPVSFKVGDITLVASTRNTYIWDDTNKIATWRWNGDVLNIYDKTGLELAVVIRKAA